MYLWIKALHIIAVISWMAALFYLPRLFVYHAELPEHGERYSYQMLLTMERRLITIIMNPAFIVTVLAGGGLFFLNHQIIYTFWFWIKFFCVVCLGIFHYYMVHCYHSFAGRSNSLSGRAFRLMNEIPTVLMMVIVLFVVLKPEIGLFS